MLAFVSVLSPPFVPHSTVLQSFVEHENVFDKIAARAMFPQTGQSFASADRLIVKSDCHAARECESVLLPILAVQKRLQSDG